MPTGVDRPVLELYQLMLNIPEVTTNLVFEMYSTLPLEVRMKEQIQLNSIGKIRRNDNNNQGDGDDSDADAQISGLLAEKNQITRRT